MGRSGYTEWDDCDEYTQWAMIRQAGALKSAVRGKRGQDFLRRLAAALDAMPEKSLCAIPDEVDYDPVTEPCAGRLGLSDGQVCVLGSLALAEGRDPKAIDATDHKALGGMFNVAPIIVRQLEWDNDQPYGHDRNKSDGEARWSYLREWVREHLRDEATPRPEKSADAKGGSL